MRFRPCIDLHEGRVKQIVGGTLKDRPGDGLMTKTNFESERPAEYYARLYKRDGLEGGHVIMLGGGNERAAESALSAYPGGLQIGGGITPDNAPEWLRKGAAKVIVTSYVFRDGRICWDRLNELIQTVGVERLVLDLSCRKTVDGSYVVATDRWQKLTQFEIASENLARLAEKCAEFLVHAVDVEGRQTGIDEQLVRLLSQYSPLPTTYAGGVRHLDDLFRIEKLGRGKIDATAGSCLDIFGGNGLKYTDAVAFDQARRVAVGRT